MTLDEYFEIDELCRLWRISSSEAQKTLNPDPADITQLSEALSAYCLVYNNMACDVFRGDEDARTMANFIKKVRSPK